MPPFDQESKITSIYKVSLILNNLERRSGSSVFSDFSVPYNVMYLIGTRLRALDGVGKEKYPYLTEICRFLIFSPVRWGLWVQEVRIVCVFPCFSSVSDRVSAVRISLKMLKVRISPLTMRMENPWTRPHFKIRFLSDLKRYFKNSKNISNNNFITYHVVLTVLEKLYNETFGIQRNSKTLQNV